MASITPLTTPNDVSPDIASQIGAINANVAKLNTTGTTSTTTPATTSPTVISSANKVADVPNIIQTATNNANVGVTTNPQSGVATYADGTVYNPPDYVTNPQNYNFDTYGNATAKPASSNPVNPTISKTGGYDANGMYYSPNSTAPVDADGNPQALTPTSPIADKQIADLNDAKASADANTASLITSLTNNYQQLISQQQQANAGQLGKVQNALLMGGATGQGSSAQFAPISSEGIISSQIAYGTQQLTDLQNKMASAITAAQQAGQDEDFKLMDAQNKIVNDLKAQQQAVITAMNDKITAAKTQASIDNGVAGQVAKGITDPGQILTTLRANGDTTTTLSDIANSLKTISDANGTTTSKLSTDINTFNWLKGQPNGLPTSITDLGSTAEQLAAYLKMVNSQSSSVIAKGIVAGGNETTGAGAGATNIAYSANVSNPSIPLSETIFIV